MHKKKETQMSEMDTQEEQQSTMAIALSLATEINQGCLCIDDVKEVLVGLSGILKIRFGSAFYVLLQGSHK
jgi:hypothetical protein